jgi:hypothetical protein
MPRYKNTFAAPEYVDHTIINRETGELVGTLRLKPASVLWKSAKEKYFRAVRIDIFAEWITENGYWTKW